MKKLLFALSMMLFIGAATANAQTIPQCNNVALVEAQINAIENQGWQETSRTFVPINYLVQPEAPYVAGTVTVFFSPVCEAGEPCPAIGRIFQADVVVINDNGTCIYQF